MLLNSISKKNMLGYVVIFTVLVVTSFWLYGQMESVHQKNSVLINQTLPAQATSETVIDHLNRLQLDAFQLYGTTLSVERFSSRFQQNQQGLETGLTELSKLNPKLKGTLRQSADVLDAIRALQATMANTQIDWDGARNHLNRIQSSSSTLRDELTQLNHDISEEAHARASSVDKQVNAIQSSVPLFLLFVSSIIIGAYFLSRFTIAQPIFSLSKKLDKLAENKDLSMEIAVHTNDEVAIAARSVNVLVSAFRDGTQEVRHSAGTLLTSVQQMNDSALSGDTNVEQLSLQLQQLLASIETLESSIGESAARSLSVSESAQLSAQQVKSGAENVRKTSVSIATLASNIETSREKLLELQNAGDQVSSVVKAIADIAEQTNLLALNAAIEAARAGESGRGFAVVADEVRTLASRTHDSTHEINSILASIVSSISTTVEQMASNSESAVATVELAEDTVASLTTIEQSVIGLSQENQQLSEQAQITQQDAGSMRNTINQIHSVTDNVTQSAKETRVAATQLAELSTRLDNVSKIFTC